MAVAGTQNRYVWLFNKDLLSKLLMIHITSFFQNEAYCFFPTPTFVVQSVNKTALGFKVHLINANHNTCIIAANLGKVLIWGLGKVFKGHQI